MRGMSLDEAHLIMLFPLSLSKVAHNWFATLDASHKQTWEDLAHEFMWQFFFSTVIDVTRKELEAIRQGAYETATSFISHWREKVIQMIDLHQRESRLA